jgi:hypothetical protein
VHNFHLFQVVKSNKQAEKKGNYLSPKSLNSKNHINLNYNKVLNYNIKSTYKTITHNKFNPTINYQIYIKNFSRHFLSIKTKKYFNYEQHQQL